MYLILKWVHILLAITAVGANITYGIWLARVDRSPEHAAFVLRGVKILDDRVANPAYALLLVTGLGLVFMGNWSLTTPWLLAALVLYAVVFVLGLFGYTPMLRRRIELLEAGGLDSPEYAALAARGRILGIVLGVLAVAISFLMVVKPSL